LSLDFVVDSEFLVFRRL